MTRPSIVTGMGVVGPCGRGVDALWEALMHGAPRAEIAHFETARLRGAGLIPGEEDRHGDPDRLLELLVAAAGDALRDARLEPGPSTAIVVGTTDAGGNHLAHGPGRNGGPPPDPRAAFPGWVAERAAERLGIGGEALTVATASAAGGCALAVARDLLLAGDADAVVAAGVDCVTETAFHGLASLRTLGPQGCRPFSAERRGIGISEGAAAIVLEAPGARAGAPARGMLLGAGACNEADHLAAPRPAAVVGAARAALADAGVSPEEVDLVNAHAAGTPAGDLVEVDALRQVLGERFTDVALVSSKGALWHWQGGAGVVEAMATILSLERDTVAPTLCAEPLDDLDGGDVVLEARRVAPGLALSISTGLGGINAAAVLGRAA